MRYKVWQSIWLLALLILLRSGDFGALAAGDDTYNYNQQVVVVLRNDQSTLEAAWYLYGKHPSTSFIVELNNEGLEQVNVKWNEETKLFESVPTEDPPGINHDDWKNTRIQVIGHGIIDSGEETTIGGFQAKDLAIFLIDNLIHGRVMGRISILGCTGKRRDAGTPYTPPELGSDDTPPYLKAFVENLKEDGVKDTTVTMRSALVSVDHSGRKLTGERYPLNEQIHANPEVGIIWTHKDISKSWIGEIKNGEVKYSKKELGGNSEMMPPKYFGILPKDSPLYVSTSEATYGLIDSDALEWVDKEIAQEIYDSIDPAAGPLAETNLEVAFLDGSTEYKNVRVIESAHDLLRELVYFGNKGVELDKRTGMKKGTGDKVFYRFGDWVVSMEMNRFYMNVEGIITTDDGNKEEEENRVKEVRGMWEKYMQKEEAEAIAKYNEIKQQLPESDPEMIRIRDRKAAFEKKILPSDYKNMLLGVGDDFFDNVRSWINGDHSSIGLNIENAYNAQCGLALFMSESIRCFQTHITNMMGLDLAKHGYLTKEYFIETHPMARGKTWVMRKKGTNILETGLEMLRHDPFTKEEKRVEKVFDTTKSLISRIAKSWLSHAEVIGESVLSHDCPNCLEGSTNSPTEGNLDTSEGAKVKLFQKLSTLKTIGSGPPSQEFLRDYDLTKPLLSTKITEPEVGSVKTQVTQFSNTEDISSPLRASMALANDHAYVSNEISKEVQQKEKETGKVYEVVPDSVTVDEIGDSLSFQVYDKNYPASEAEEVKTTIDRTKLESKAFMDDLETKANELQAPENPEGKLSKINRGLAIYGVVSGLGGAISSFEDGNITQGMIGMSQSLHGIGELSGVNRAIYKAAGKFLGRILRNQVESVSDMVSTVAGEDTGKLFSFAGGELLSTIGDVGDFLEDVPIVGTAFGIYNIYEDFQQHSVLGYIDAGLDSAITGLSFLGPEAEPIIMALTVIRMGIGAFYNDISKELKNLPPDASVSEKVGAVFKGIGEAFLDLWEEFSLPGMIFGAIKNSHELDKEYDHDREFLRNLSNYKNYFTIEGSGAKEINFAGGSESWNGGDITFHLGEPGEDSILTVEDVDSNGKLRTQTATFETSGVQDIIMGIGESHKIRFKKHTVKFLWFIPVHSRTLISGNTSLTDTLHGSYSGNSKDNKFIAVQQLPPNTNSLGYSLQDYHYKLFGREGNDAFYLGPQRSYAEGNDGSDTYYVNTTSVNAEINNYATDKKTDYMILNLDYDQLIPNRKGLDVQITTSNERHNILIDNWFHSDTYQHMIFKTEDGVLFKISATGTGGATFIPYALTGIASEKSVELDARKSDLSRVVTLIGSDHDDVLYGNDQDNQLNGGKGDDTLTGGEGKDTYTIHTNEGKDTIDNYAKDGKTDILFFPAKFDDIKGSSDSSNDDVILSGKGSEGATIKNWFSSPIYRHMLAVSDDGVVFNVSHIKETTVKLQPIMVDMALMQPSDSCQDYNDLCYHRVINLTADPLLHDIVTVLGSDERDMIVGNFKNNYITAGKGVVDIVIGGEGQDTYAFKRTDEDYSITNVARDQSVDALLFDNDFHDIELSAVEGTALAIRNNKQNAGQVVLQCWFRCDDCMLTSEPMRHHLPFFHHLLVRSIDGVVFELPTDSEHVVKIPRVVDKSKQVDGVYLDLSNETFSMVQRVLGSQGKDIIQGNSLSNYIDPGVGGCYVEGRNGSDTYVIQDGYGEDNTINNYAEDERPDTLLFRAPFFTIDAKVCGNSKDLRLTSEASGFSTMLSNYTSDPKYRHLMVISEDGYSFVLPAVSNYKPVPIIINRARTTTGQHINLTSNATFSEVITVYGSNTYQNCIIGNQQKNTLIGGSEDDLLIGNGGNDVIKGGAGVDTLQGGPGDDTLVGGAGNDRLEGGDGDDIMAPGLGSNVVDGGNGSDTVIYIGRSATGVDLDLQGQFCQENLFGVELQMPDDTMLPGFERDKLHSIENAYGTEYGDWLYGNDEDNVLVGLGGNDILLPGTGYDILNGGKGNDTYLLDSAKGTVTIVNYATDGALDKASMTYANVADLRYEKVGNDLVVRSINIRYPVFFDEQQPTVIFKDWFVDSVLYHHVYIQANDGMIKLETLEVEGKKAEERNTLSMQAKN